MSLCPKIPPSLRLRRCVQVTSHPWFSKMLHWQTREGLKGWRTQGLDNLSSVLVPSLLILKSKVKIEQRRPEWASQGVECLAACMSILTRRQVLYVQSQPAFLAHTCPQLPHTPSHIQTLDPQCGRPPIPGAPVSGSLPRLCPSLGCCCWPL